MKKAADLSVKPRANNKYNNKILYFISFVEGGAVMVTEISSAKLLSPYFGASIYSWASTLSITLLALMCGYYTGGYVTTKPKYQSAERIVWVFLLSGLFIMLMPSIARFMMTQTLTFSFFSGLLISQLFFLFPPVFLMAMISPMIIFQITSSADESGKSAGSIYAISTSGGIFFTLLIGFFIIPEYGISVPVTITGLCVLIIAAVLLILQKSGTGKLSILIALALPGIFVLYNKRELPSLEKITFLERSEGLLGELTVLDQAGRTPEGKPMKIRSLRTNNVTQNSVLANNPAQSLLFYVNFTRQLLTKFPDKNSALLIGLGAGSLYRIMREQYKEVASVELDKRIYDYGVQYFGMAEHANVVDDGRHFINTCKEKFDLVMIDVIVGENVPEQMISLESFSKCRDLLTDSGIMIIENGAVYDFSSNSFAPSIIKTLKAAGFQVSVFNPLRSNEAGDILYVASKKGFNYNNLSIDGDMTFKGGPLSGFIVNPDVFDTEHAKLLTDDRNYTDKQLMAYYLAVREKVRNSLNTELTYIKATEGR